MSWRVREALERTLQSRRGSIAAWQREDIDALDRRVREGDAQRPRRQVGRDRGIAEGTRPWDEWRLEESLATEWGQMEHGQVRVASADDAAERPGVGQKGQGSGED